MTVSSTNDMITAHRLFANKQLGQHFLTDPFLLDKIVNHARLRPEHHVLEVGPGPGGLTRAIMQRDVTSITACELDMRCVDALQELVDHDHRLRVVHGDALEMTLTSLCSAPRAIVANLPYNVGTAIIMNWLRQLHSNGASMFDSATVMLQREVVDRMAATPDSKLYGRLSVLCQWLCHIDVCMEVGPEHFSPPPKVMSAVVRLTPRDKPAFSATFTQVESLLHAMFSQRRKMLRRSLKSLVDEPDMLLQCAHIDPMRRPETLELHEIAAIIHQLQD